MEAKLLNEYDKQSEDFLKSTNTTFKAVFLKHEIYFDDDDEKRDIYIINLVRKEKDIDYIFKFGQSINDSNGKTPPNIYDVLTGLTKNNPETYKDFCNECGYDEDSRKAEKTYKAVVKEWDNVKNLWDSQELEKLQEIN